MADVSLEESPTTLNVDLGEVITGSLAVTDSGEVVSVSGGSTITTGTLNLRDRGEILSLEGQATVNAISGTLSITNGRQSVSLSGATKNEGTLNLTDRGERLVLLESEPPRLAVLDARLTDALTFDATLTD